MIAAATLRAVLSGGVLALVSACAPRARPLGGAPAPVTVRVPIAALPAGHEKVVFRWRYAEGETGARGEGVARIAPPDSARLDLFLDGGLGGTHAQIIGDEIRAPGGALGRRYLPPPPLLWAALGRLAVPPAPDTIVRVDGDTLRADIGVGTVWRVAFVAGRLTRLERIDGGRIVEWVSRGAGDEVRYEHESARRSLALTIVRREGATAFDPSIWRP